MLLQERSCICMPSFRSVAPRVFLAKITFLVFSWYHGNYFLDFLSPSFKLGQSLSSCQVSEKSTCLFGQNDGTNIHTNISFYIYTSSIYPMLSGQYRLKSYHFWHFLITMVTILLNF